MLMKSLELKATDENIYQTLVNDSLERNKDIYYFLKLVDSLEESCAISLEGEWGCGKTFFVKQVKLVFDAFNPYVNGLEDERRKKIQRLFDAYLTKNQGEFCLQPHVAVYYDAWANDNDEDPVLSLIYSIIKDLNITYSLPNEPDYLKVAVSVAEMVTGRNLKELFTSLKGGNSLEALASQKSLKQNIDCFFDTLLEEQGSRLIVFIDELDRCNPNYAVKLLERIKHYFDNERITFVFSMNLKELQHTIRNCYGNEFDGSRYLDRFFDLRTSLTPVSYEKYLETLQCLTEKGFFESMCKEVISYFNFELREISKFVCISRIAAYKPTHKSSGVSFNDGTGNHFCWDILIPIMIGLKIADIDRYNDFISGKDGSCLIDIMTNCNVGEWYRRKLLNYRESYEPLDDENIVVVDLEDKLKQVYKALFMKEEKDAYGEITIGDMSFSRRTREMLRKTESLLSQYAMYEI